MLIILMEILSKKLDIDDVRNYDHITVTIEL